MPGRGMGEVGCFPPPYTDAQYLVCSALLLILTRTAFFSSAHDLEMAYGSPLIMERLGLK